MQGKPQGILKERDKLGRYRCGYNPRIAKQIRIAAKVEELRHEFFPCGGESHMDASRLMLAAKHYVTAETCRDPVVASVPHAVRNIFCRNSSRRPRHARQPWIRPHLRLSSC